MFNLIYIQIIDKEIPKDRLVYMDEHILKYFLALSPERTLKQGTQVVLSSPRFKILVSNTILQ